MRYFVVRNSITLLFLSIITISANALNLAERLQMISGKIESITKMQSIIIDEVIIATLLKGDPTTNIKIGKYSWDGARHKFEGKQFEGLTIEEAVKKNKNNDDEIPIELKEIWTKTRTYHSSGTTNACSVWCYAEKWNLHDGPLFPCDSLKISYDHDKELCAEPENKDSLEPQIITLPDGTSIQQYHIIKKSKKGDLFAKYQFSADDKIVWPLLMEWGGYINDKDYVSTRIKIDIDTSSLLGYKGYEVESISLKASLYNTLWGYFSFLRKFIEPDRDLFSTTKIILTTMPVTDRPIPEGDFDFLVPKGLTYNFHESYGANPVVTVAKEADMIIHPE